MKQVHVVPTQRNSSAVLNMRMSFLLYNIKDFALFSWMKLDGHLWRGVLGLEREQSDVFHLVIVIT